MDRIIPNVIEELNFLDTLPSKYTPLIDYYTKVGSLANIHTGDVYEYEGIELRIGQMISRIRLAYKRGMLNDEEIQLLNRLGMEWSYDRFAALRAYYKEFGTLSTITHETTYTYNQKTVNLGSIVYHLRHDYKRGVLSKALIDEFNKMDIIWGIKLKNEELIEILEAYCNKYGDLSVIIVKDKFTHAGKKVCINTQIAKLRRMYSEGRLSAEEIAKLESMGMVWQARKTFEQNIEILKAYCAEHNNLNDVRGEVGFVYQNKKVYINRIIYSLRVAYRNKELSKEEIANVEKLGLSWEIVNKPLNKLEPIIAYYKEHGTISNITCYSKYEYNGQIINIGQSITNLRRPERKAKLSKEEVELLDQMGMVWDPNIKTAFEQTIEPLEDYCEKHGTIADITVSTIHVYNGKEWRVGDIIVRLRAKYNKGELSKKQMDTLLRMGLELRSDYRKMVDKLIDYYERIGSLSNIKANDTYIYNGKKINIHRSIAYLRSRYKKGKLTQAQIEELESMGMEWAPSQKLKQISADEHISVSR